MKKHLIGMLFVALAAPGFAQSTVGELLDKGGKKLVKADYDALAPFRTVYVWPQGGGEGDLVYKPDGTLSGSEYQYSSRSESPAVGTWNADDEGKWCIKKHMTTWNSRTDRCWYTWQLGTDFYGSAETDRSARIAKLKSVAKQ
jgi:hypothetical protein